MVSLAGAFVFITAVLSAGNDVTLHMAAVQATNEGRATKYFDPVLNEIKRAIAPLDYDTFRAIKTQDVGLPFGKRAEIVINDRYRLQLEPVGRDADNRVRIQVCILRVRGPDDPPMKALDTTLLMAPGKHLSLGGLPLEQGELVVILELRSS